jgi:RND family efflux transporter MFP subunit
MPDLGDNSGYMNSVPLSGKRRRWPWAIAVIVVALAIGTWWFATSRNQEAKGAARPSAPTVVVTTTAEARDVPVKIKANGTVTALQTVDLRAQVTSTVREVHIREGQNVAKGDLLFTLDDRVEVALSQKAVAQVEKDKADLATAERNLKRQKDLFDQKFISQAALDTAQNQVDTLKGQIAVDMAAADGARIARGFSEIRAPFAGRTGVIGVRAGSLVQPSANTASSPPLVTITQIDPISVSFTLPEKELPALQQALARGTVTVTAAPPNGGESFSGKVSFVDNAVDSTTGTIRVKADFANSKLALWPGMYVNVEVSPRVLQNATVIPAQAVQTGPDSRFVFVVGEDRKVASRPVTLSYIEEKFAVVQGLEPGARVIVEGAQNVRPGAVVAEARPENSAPAGASGERSKGKGKKAS